MADSSFLLVTRFRRYVSESDRPWQEIVRLYPTLDDALRALNWQNEKGEYMAANVTDEDQFIGLWELRDDAKVTLSSEKIVRVERRVSEHRDTRVLWTTGS